MLKCSCCGNYFNKWKGYQDQDQGDYFGICKKCQDWIEGDQNAKLDELCSQIWEGLSDKNRAKFDAMSIDERRAVATGLIYEGYVSFEIQRS